MGDVGKGTNWPNGTGCSRELCDGEETAWEFGTVTCLPVGLVALKANVPSSCMRTHHDSFMPTSSAPSETAAVTSSVSRGKVTVANLREGVVRSAVCKKSLKHMGCTPDSPRRDFSTTMCTAGVAPVTFSTMGFLILTVVLGRGVLHVPVPSRSRTACFQRWRRLSGDTVESDGSYGEAGKHQGFAQIRASRSVARANVVLLSDFRRCGTPPPILVGIFVRDPNPNPNPAPNPDLNPDPNPDPNLNPKPSQTYL